MAAATDLSDEISSILRRIPGLDLIAMFSGEGHCQFEMTLASWEALLLVAHAGMGANVPLSVYSRCNPGSSDAVADPSRAIVCQFLIREDDESSYIEKLEVLGAHLTWGMHTLSWITTEDANRALDLFRAVPVPRSIR